MNLSSTNVFRQLVSRAVRTDYLENVTGFAWLILQPLILLAVYAFVFTTIFKARIPDAGPGGFVPYLAVAFWPWTAFSEAVLRSSNSISANAALIGKVAFPSELLPLSTVTATFLMNMAGYLAVLIVLQLMGAPIHWTGLLAALPVLALLYIFACGLGLFISALQVFIRDVSQILPPLMTFWFFTTPILYSMSILPGGFASAMKFNPMTWYVGRLRDFLLLGNYGVSWYDLLVPLLTVLLFWASLAFFRRFSPHFEDFL
ncbi:MAG: ABC transporter permease [Gammaproteobacteria bacterium]|jgi:ABC-type polysaccharide/polyol phosphate export permease|nr:ABC transporter permease [Gammaproteobacteria bacterium]